MFTYFQFKQAYRYIDILKDLVESYYKRFYRPIKMAPAPVNKDNDHLAWENTYARIQDESKIKFKFRVSDYVRLSYFRKPFDESYQQQWSGEITIVKEQLKTKPPTYKLNDFTEEEITGLVYKKNCNGLSKMKIRPIRLKRSYNRQDVEDKRII